MFETVLQSTIETLYMIFFSALFSFIIGLPIAIILYITREDGLKENKFVFTILDFLINIFRSIPFIILLIILRPLSYLLIKKTIGSTASIISLTVAATPFMARIIETSFLKVDKGIIEAAKSMGSSTWQIITKVLFKESLPNLVNDITVTVISLVGYSAMAGSIGGGGLGNLAVRYGLYNYQLDYLIIAIVIIIILVQIFQFIGSTTYKKINKK